MRRIGAIIMLLWCWSLLYSQTRVEAEQIIETTRQYMHCPYKYGATGPNSFDCSGLVQFCFAKHNIRLPRTSQDQSNNGVSVSGGWDSLQTGDLVFFGKSKVNHVGIYVGTPSRNRHEFIHCSQSKGVAIAALEDSYWKSHYKFARRLELVESEPIVIAEPVNVPETTMSVSSAPQTVVGDAPASSEVVLDNVIPYRTKRWKTKINRKNREKVTWAKE